MRLMNRWVDPPYTDIAVVLGHTMRGAEQDYADLMRYRPELLLGYRVYGTTPRQVSKEGAARGMVISKVVVTAAAWLYARRVCEALPELEAQRGWLPWPVRVEMFDPRDQLDLPRPFDPRRRAA